MKSDTFLNRLKSKMSEKGIKQVDLVNKTKIDKTLLNKYLKGISEPKQDNLELLAKALDVNEVWLMGYDVPDSINWTGVVHDDERNGFIFKFNNYETVDSVQSEYEINEDNHKEFKQILKDKKLMDTQENIDLSRLQEMLDLADKVEQLTKKDEKK